MESIPHCECVHVGRRSGPSSEVLHAPGEIVGYLTSSDR